MIRTIGVFIFSVLLVGCATDGSFKAQKITGGPCEGAVGYTHTIIAYGDGKVVVKPMSDIRPNSEWRFYLRLDPRLGGGALEKSNVTVDGKAADTMVVDPTGKALVKYALPTPPDNDDWLYASGDYDSAPVDKNNNHYLTVCVPAEVKKDQNWYYKVKIINVGEVDPRGRVL